MMSAIVIDDDKLSGMLLSTFIERSAMLELKSVFTDPGAALEYVHRHRPDLIFLDIEMPGMNGMEFIEAIGDKRPAIILVTAHKEFALAAFEHHVNDFLVKPVEFPRFMEAVGEIQKRKQEQDPEAEDDKNIFLRKGKILVRVNKSDILCAEARGDYVVVRTKDESFIMRSTLKAFEEKLSSTEHLRVHRSFLVRVGNIISIEENSITLGKQQIPIGKSYREVVFKRLHAL